MFDAIRVGKQIYNMENSSEARRCVVFVIRCLLHPQKMKRLQRFFSSNEKLARIAEEYGFVYEQPTRAFFYNKSTFDERIKLVEEHMTYLTEHLKGDTAVALYRNQSIELWQSQDEGDTPLTLKLTYHPGQRKEGLMSVWLDYEGQALYQMMFWIAKDRNDEWSLFIGAMQGPHMDHSRDVIKKVTKRCHAYRTKNLILHATQEVAKALDLKHIYAVTNYGYYANNHVRRDRKLKTDFGAFWAESGGKLCDDRRFYELPLTEYRKTMEEIPTRKRANYRKRFALLDEIDASIAINLRALRA